MSPTRRALLRTVATASSAGSLAALAGCLGETIPTGDDESPTPTPTPDPGQVSARDVRFLRWLPDPAATPLRDGYGVQVYDTLTLRARRDDLHPNASDRLQSEARYAGPDERYVDYERVDATVEVGFDAAVALGSFDPDAFRERWTDDRTESRTDRPKTATRTPTDQPESYGEFTLFGTDRVFAVSEDAVVEVERHREGDALTYVKAILDARTDETDYTDGNAYADALLGLVDGPHAMQCYVEAMDGSTSRGFREDVITGGLKSWRFGRETTQFTFGNTYSDADAAADADVAGHLDADRFDVYEGLGVTTEDRLIWADGEVSTDQFDFLSPGGPGDGVHTPNG
ncbi:hypothetical protein N0B31_20130 [Salinirubellus salinus]|uniref:Uncharacterized protein n=1 Tax=Salinirubellus salinus TaxID=1364945 RepID=A0A9E7R364_9EURY|nr:hypothetical protein [Salinirubellus salinus]UWM54414.1 hypothetical protein N0B31_20130 [Salinirubellus salinus]